MQPIAYDIIGFDLDGTLVDTSEDIMAAVNHALADIGRGPLDRATVEHLIGGGTVRMLTRAAQRGGSLDDVDIDALHERFRDYYKAHIAVHSHPYPGVAETLDALRDVGLTLGVATNKGEAMADRLLSAIGLRDRFACLIGGDTLAHGKPHPAMLEELTRRCGGGRTAYVGDSEYDVQAARNAGVPVVVMSFGYANLPALDLGADAVLDRFDELPGRLARLGG
ncbi:phosphoglycolate phosphatase [Stakelama saccharophila]|uniref:Phosphoglycolate phosphatase n=1 Tax=Stakelama saccharophila TaxID=3075605 RepID=A0ABZ0B7Q6_9SPHN|nr:phosphoglycolate phosphatase [Stakelama sp. W311]WNO53035.1 phosphoglycolate phosphatase [Stakelama sp. W311]